MKNIIVCGLIAVIIALASCHRNYQVIHTRPAVDTITHDDIEKVADEDPLKDPLIDIPDAPQESDFKKVHNSDLKEYDKYIKGQE